LPAEVIFATNVKFSFHKTATSGDPPSNQPTEAGTVFSCKPSVLAKPIATIGRFHHFQQGSTYRHGRAASSMQS
jgi:hypothetical protein